MVNFAELTPQPHWSKEIIKRHNVPLGAVSKHLELSYQYVSLILSGNSKATPETEEKLKALCDGLEGS